MGLLSSSIQCFSKNWPHLGNARKTDVNEIVHEHVCGKGAVC